jgi:hypothetical protein
MHPDGRLDLPLQRTRGMPSSAVGAVTRLHGNRSNKPHHSYPDHAEDHGQNDEYFDHKLRP